MIIFILERALLHFAEIRFHEKFFYTFLGRPKNRVSPRHNAVIAEPRNLKVSYYKGINMIANAWLKIKRLSSSG